jgi:hypothetical protein
MNLVSWKILLGLSHRNLSVSGGRCLLVEEVHGHIATIIRLNPA